RSETPSDRGAAIKANDPVPSHQGGEQGPGIVREDMAMEVVDEPAQPRFALHEADEGRELLLAHMMRDEARDHVIETASRQTGVVAREICNRLRTGLGLGDHFAAGIEIDAGQMRLDTALPRPSV